VSARKFFLAIRACLKITAYLQQHLPISNPVLCGLQCLHQLARKHATGRATVGRLRQHLKKVSKTDVFVDRVDAESGCSIHGIEGGGCFYDTQLFLSFYPSNFHSITHKTLYNRSLPGCLQIFQLSALLDVDKLDNVVVEEIWAQISYGWWVVPCHTQSKLQKYRYSSSVPFGFYVSFNRFLCVYFMCLYFRIYSSFDVLYIVKLYVMYIIAYRDKHEWYCWTMLSCCNSDWWFL